MINEITKINIDKLKFETEATFIFGKRKRIDFNFRNLENQLEPFFEEIKKRNTRIKIEHI